MQTAETNQRVHGLDVAPQRQYLTFQLAGEEYGLAVLTVREIIEYRTITPVPMTPRWLLGVINLRGSVVPVIDLACRFDLQSHEITKRTCVIITEVHTGDELVNLGIVVDSVREVIFLDPEQVQPTPEIGGRDNLLALEGIVHIDGRFILLIDSDKALDMDAVDATMSGLGETPLAQPPLAAEALDAEP